MQLIVSDICTPTPEGAFQVLIFLKYHLIQEIQGLNKGEIFIHLNLKVPLGI